MDRTVTVEAPCGRLTGLAQSAMLSFRGIPYAKPPVGALRWRMPEPLPPWSGTRDATQFGAAAPQASTLLAGLSGGAVGMQSEDCLYLNVWTPACDGAKRPVMVWIHGGAFALGAGHQTIYHGQHLAARGCVVVTINYRLGAFGFLALEDGASGAEGLADQIRALAWVKENIAAFGGDAGNVTIFGESAGGMSVAALLASPMAQGLFHKAIAQSGAGHIGNGHDRAARVTRAVLDALHIAPENAVRLRGVPQDALIKAQVRVMIGAREGKDARKLGALPFQPAYDNAVLPLKPIDAVRAGSAKGVPLLTGTTKEEWKLFTAAMPNFRFMSAKKLTARATRLDKDAAPAMLAAYHEGSPFARFIAIMTDKAFTIPATRLLEAQGAHASTYAYRFDWRSPLFGGYLGACHAIDLGFVFGTYGAKYARAVFGKGSAADALSNTTMDAWVAFAGTGDPSTTALAWPRYDAQTRQTMRLGDGAPRTIAAPDEARLRAWDAMPERKLGP